IRKLSSKMHMSAANMYNYFFNKDEIYLHILIKGFNLLKEQQLEAVAAHKDPIERFRYFMQSFIRFGVENKSYYALMFSTLDPKSLDYLDSPMQAMAEQEKATAMDVFEDFKKFISEE
ncbi:MAG: hypothetical protein RR614_07920, partial [Eubacterium sp.]